MKKVLIAGIYEHTANYRDALTQLGAACEVSLNPEDAEKFDALLLPGGGDVDPSFYGETNQESAGIDIELDRKQFEILDWFVKAKRPIMAICRGHQLLNVYFGGTLIQNLPTAESHRHLGYDQAHISHAIPGSVPAQIYGTEFPINSAHHQGIKDLGKGLTVIQTAPDGVIEAVAHETLPVISVQWHPERMCFSRKREDTVDGSLLLSYFLSMIP